MVTVLPGVPPVTPIIHAVGFDEGAVQRQVLRSCTDRFDQDGGQFGGWGGEHVEGFVQVAVGAGEADRVVAGQVRGRGALAHEPQQ